MKFTSLILMVTVSLCAGLCCGEDDNYNSSYVNYSVVNDNLITIQNNSTTINVGETITIETVVEDQQENENGEVVFISNVISEDSSLIFELVLYKLNIYNNIERVALNEESILQIEGNAFIAEESNAPFVGFSSVLSEGNSHVNTTGFTILEPGTYYIGANYYNNNFGSVIISGNSSIGGVQLYTKIVNSNEEGLYEFSVN